MSMTPHDLTLPDGSTLQYFMDEAPLDGAALLIYHHGTPAAGPIEPELVDAARAARLTIVELVRPGYGGSTRQAGRSVADVAPLTAALADHLGHERFVTVGWSGGGPHAIATAALLPERCMGVLSMASVAPFGEPDLDYLAGMGEDNIAEFGASVAGEQELEAFLTETALGLSDVTGDEIVAELASLLPEVDRALLVDGGGEQLAEEMRWSLSTGIWGWFDDDRAFVAPWGFDVSDVTPPILVLQGTDDLMVPFAHGQWLADKLPRAEAYLLDGEGHLSLINYVGERLADLRGLLDG